jgi:hypothetical protein
MAALARKSVLRTMNSLLTDIQKNDWAIWRVEMVLAWLARERELPECFPDGLLQEEDYFARLKLAKNKLAELQAERARLSALDS